MDENLSTLEHGETTGGGGGGFGARNLAHKIIIYEFFVDGAPVAFISFFAQLRIFR
jgi:hypothetical protein